MIHKKSLLPILLAALLLFGCDRQQSGSIPAAESSEPSSASQAENQAPQIPAITSPPAELVIPGTINVYRFFGDGQIYEAKETAYSGEGNLLAAMNHIAGSLGVTEPLPILSITQQKGFVVVNFGDSLLDQFDKSTLNELLTTLVMTLQRNVMTVENMQFQLDGEVGVFGETFDPPPLAFAPGDPAEFAAICAGIPYAGLPTVLPYIPETLSALAGPDDGTAQEIMLFLSALGQIEKDAASPAELDQERLTMSCIWATAPYYSAPYDSDKEHYRKELGPIADSVSAKLGMREDMFWIAEHVRQTARLLCGDDFTLQLTEENCAPWKYFEQEGVITPPHMGGGYDVLPFVLDYKATTEGYRVEAVYIYASMGGYSLWQSENVIPENQLADFVQNKAPRREIILKRAADGGLRFVSHRFL